MKAKEVVAKMQAVPSNVDESLRADMQAETFIDCAWEEFRRVVKVRFPAGKASMKSLLSFRQEMSNWGEAVSRIGKFSWMRPSAGTLAFHGFLKMLGGDDVSEGMIALDRASRPDVSPDVLRQGL